MTRPKVANPEGLRVLIVDDDKKATALQAQLQKLGHVEVGRAADAAGATALFASEKPDLVLLDTRLKEGDCIALAEALVKERQCPVIIISDDGESESIDRASDAGVFGYLIKPVSDRSLEAQLQVAVKRFEEQEELRHENEKLLQDLETRKVLSRAKGILMKRANMSEEDAHKRIQHESQNRRVPMAELCKRIIESDEVMGPGTGAG